MARDAHLLSAQNPVANVDQREREDLALRLAARPEFEKARGMVAYLYREVMEHPFRDQMHRFENTVDEYLFHYAMRAVASDAQHPVVLRFMTPPHHWFGRDVPGSRWGGDSPDFVYRMIPVAHGSRYRIRGRPTCENAPTVHYALMGDTLAAPTILSLLDSLDMTYEQNGEFEITLDDSPAEGRSNHIQTQPGSWQIWIRDALADWGTQTPNDLRVERLDAPARGPLDEDELTQLAVRSLLEGVYYAYYMPRTITAKPPNQVCEPISSGPFGGMSTQYTSRANVVLEDDMALIVTASGAGALFRNTQLYDMFLLSLDYWKDTSSFASGQLAPDEDGRFTYVIAHEDPGVHNWIDTGGLRQTVFGHRWQSFPRDGSAETPTIEGRLVKFRELEKELPAGVRRVSDAERKQQLAERQRGYELRFIDR